MAPTRIADVIVPEVFNPYVTNRTAELSALEQSGIVSTSAELNRLASAGGRLINMPFWNDLAGSDEVLSDTTALTPQNITSGQDVAPLLMRGKAWAANDLAQALAGADPMAAIGDLVAGFWARQRQKRLISMLKGVFGTPGTTGMTGNVHDISGGTGAAAVISAAEFVAASWKLGDASDSLSAVAMHSAVVAKLAADDLIEYVTPSGQNTMFATYMNKRVIVDDGLPVASGVYTSYLFGPGAIGRGDGSPEYPTETDRDSLAGDDILINREHVVLHPRGVKWNDASVAGSSPTNAELEAAANWTRVYDAKQIRIVAFKHRIASA